MKRYSDYYINFCSLCVAEHRTLIVDYAFNLYHMTSDNASGLPNKAPMYASAQTTRWVGPDDETTGQEFTKVLSARSRRPSLTAIPASGFFYIRPHIARWLIVRFTSYLID